MADNFWDESRTERLKELYQAGLSASSIASRLGAVSRNVIISKIHRLRLNTPGNKPAPKPKADARLQQLNGIAGMCCVERSIPMIRVAVATHTKAFLGAGRIPAGKRKEMTLAQCQRIGIKITSKDAADAVSVAWFGAGHMRQSLMLGADLFKGAAK